MSIDFWLLTAMKLQVPSKPPDPSNAALAIWLKILPSGTSDALGTESRRSWQKVVYHQESRPLGRKRALRVAKIVVCKKPLLLDMGQRNKRGRALFGPATADGNTLPAAQGDNRICRRGRSLPASEGLDFQVLKVFAFDGVRKVLGNSACPFQLEAAEVEPLDVTAVEGGDIVLKNGCGWARRRPAKIKIAADSFAHRLPRGANP